MNWTKDIDNVRGSCVSWFHEHAHLIDEVAGHLSRDSKFHELILNDYIKSLEKYTHKGIEIENAREMLGSELLDPRKHSGVSDIMHGISNGSVRGISAHPIKYWQEGKYKVAQEAFAHMYEAQFDEVRYREMKKYFPEALEYIEKKLEVVTNDKLRNDAKIQAVLSKR